MNYIYTVDCRGNLGEMPERQPRGKDGELLQGNGRYEHTRRLTQREKGTTGKKGIYWDESGVKEHGEEEEVQNEYV